MPTDSERIDRLPLIMPHVVRKYNWLEATPVLTRAALDIAWNELPSMTRLKFEQARAALTPSPEQAD